jgi:hypothetical protein
LIKNAKSIAASKLKNLENLLPSIRQFKCKEAEMNHSYLVEDLTIKSLAKYIGIGCIADPEEAEIMSELTGVPIVGNSLWVICMDKLEVGKVYEGCLQMGRSHELPHFKLRNSSQCRFKIINT